jgi:hypothetical protein
VARGGQGRPIGQPPRRLAHVGTSGHRGYGYGKYPWRARRDTFRIQYPRVPAGHQRSPPNSQAIMGPMNASGRSKSGVLADLLVPVSETREFFGELARCSLPVSPTFSFRAALRFFALGRETPEKQGSCGCSREPAQLGADECCAPFCAACAPDSAPPLVPSGFGPGSRAFRPVTCSSSSSRTSASRFGRRWGHVSTTCHPMSAPLLSPVGGAGRPHVHEELWRRPNTRTGEDPAGLHPRVEGLFDAAERAEADVVILGIASGPPCMAVLPPVHFERCAC